MIIIGSKALKHWYPEFPRDTPEIDVLGQFDSSKININKQIRIECHSNEILQKEFGGHLFLPADTLLTLKLSHLCWDINWDKHMWDAQWLLSKNHTPDWDLFWKLYDYWNTVHPANRRSNLSLSKEEFFTNAINYDVMEHDEIHNIINPNPMFMRVLKEGCEVELDENKYNNLTYDEKLQFIREEVYVMAWERYKEDNYRVAYSKMLKKFIMNHCPKFALTFALINYPKLLKPEYNFIEKINLGIKNNDLPNNKSQNKRMPAKI